MIWNNTVPVVQVSLEGQTRNPDRVCIRSNPTGGHQPLSVPRDRHKGQGTKAGGGLLTLEEGGNMSELLLTPSRVKINLLDSSQWKKNPKHLDILEGFA